MFCVNNNIYHMNLYDENYSLKTKCLNSELLILNTRFKHNSSVYFFFIDEYLYFKKNTVNAFLT